MFHLKHSTVLLSALLIPSVAQADPGPAPIGTAIAEYDHATGQIVVSVSGVNNWYVQSSSFSMTGDEPVGLPAGGGLASNGDQIIGETALHVYTYTDLNLGNVALPSLPLDDLTINWNAGLGSVELSNAVSYFSSGNIPPMAGINGPFLVNTITDPLDILFDASGSSDDGFPDPLSFKWDLDDDGTFEVDTGTTSTLAIADVTSTFGGFGTYPVAVEVFDGEFSDIASSTIQLAGHSPPTASLDGPYVVNTFSDPLNIMLDASSSTDDGLNEPLSFMWDLDDDGTFEVDTGTIATLDIADVTATFGGLGTFPVAVEVFDGEFSDIASSTVRVFFSQPPASVKYDPATGQIVVTIQGPNSWFIESASQGLTGDAPVGLPAGGDLLSDNDEIIGETGFSPFFYSVDLGNVAQPNLPPGDLTITWSEGLSSPEETLPVPYGSIPEPSSLALLTLGLTSVIGFKQRRRLA